MIRWLLGHWEIWLAIIALIGARIIGAYFSDIGSNLAKKNKTRVYVLRTPDGRKKTVSVGPNEDLDIKMRLAIAEDKIERARTSGTSARAG